jgi:CrcB protein
MFIWHLALVAIGGAVGSVLRHIVNLFSLRLAGPNFPWGTVAVNITGSLAMGLFIGWLVSRNGSQELRIFVATGILGGFTTFSAFSLDFATLWERGAMVEALSYALGSVLISFAALFVGLWLARSFA